MASSSSSPPLGCQPLWQSHILYLSTNKPRVHGTCLLLSQRKDILCGPQPHKVVFFNETWLWRFNLFAGFQMRNCLSVLRLPNLLFMTIPHGYKINRTLRMNLHLHLALSASEGHAAFDRTVIFLIFIFRVCFLRAVFNGLAFQGFIFQVINHVIVWVWAVSPTFSNISTISPLALDSCWLSRGH